MKLEHYPAEKLRRDIVEILRKHLDLSRFRVFFFGSRVTGGGTDRSDIDVGIEGPEPITPAAMFAIEEEIENLPTLYKIEVVDFRHVPAKFREVALKDIELITP
jgi:predicted nucleotidyltransferase